MYSISDVTKKNIERSLGISLEAFSAMTAEEEKRWITQKTNNKISYSKHRRHGIIGRGNPLLARRKIRTIEDISRKSHDLFGIWFTRVIWIKRVYYNVKKIYIYNMKQ